MTDKQKHRLLILAKFLRENVPPERFDYTSWVGDTWKGKQDLSCGTTACALGWATQVPEFKSLRMRFSETLFEKYVTEVVIRERNGDLLDSGSVIAKVFGDEADQQELFVPNGFEEDNFTPKQMARKIERFVKRMEKLGAVK